MKNSLIVLFFILFLFSCKKQTNENDCLGDYSSRHAYVGIVDTNTQSIHNADSVLFFFFDQNSMIFPDSCGNDNCSTTLSIHNTTDDGIRVKYAVEYFSATGLENWSIVDSMIIPPTSLKVANEVVSYGCENILLGTFNVTPLSIAYQ